MSYPENRAELLDLALHNISAGLKRRKIRGGGILDWTGRPVTSASYHQISHTGAKRKGSLSNWYPRRIYSDQQGAIEREELVDRSVDLFNNNPHMSGAADKFPASIIGTGLQPFPNFTPAEISLDPDTTKTLKKEMRGVFKVWAPFADAAGKMSFSSMQYLAMLQMVTYGECLALLPMISKPSRPYSLAVQMINPMRLKTPTDLLTNDKIRDGVELDSYGAPLAYWIKKSEKIMGETADVSANFVRVRAFKGNRQNVLHVYYQKSSEQVRGIPFFAPAIKFFRDMLDYLDAELVSNVVTAAYSMFVEVEDIEPEYPSAALADFTRNVNLEDGSTKEQRYEELIPGTVSYLNPGEKPHFNNPSRPGATFEPFIQVIAESIAMAVDIPQPVLFNSFRGMNYASYRSAMLEAWRVFSSQRQMFGRGFCQAPYRMLQEEAYLRNDLNLPIDFYQNVWRITGADWIGPPKGQIEPVKEDQADQMKIGMRVKSRQMVAMEKGLDFDSILDQIDDEEKEIESRGLVVNPDAKYGQNEETSTEANNDES